MEARLPEPLKHALQALAAPAEFQLARYPAFTVRADEIALEFDDALALALPQASSWTAEQSSYLTALNAALTTFSAKPVAEWFWTDDAVRDSDQWATLREVARDTLAAFGWPIELPPPLRGQYVR